MSLQPFVKDWSNVERSEHKLPDAYSAEDRVFRQKRQELYISSRDYWNRQPESGFPKKNGKLGP